MPIFQTTLWVCAECNRVESNTQEVNLFDDPMVDFPPNKDGCVEAWGFAYIGGMPKIVCPDCMNNGG